MTEPLPVPQQGPAGEFRLDVDVASQAVAALVKVRGDLAALHVDAVEVGRHAAGRPGARDAVSREAFDLLSLKADGGADSLTAAIDSGISCVDALIAQMKADIAEQQQIDDAAERSFRA